MKHPAESASDAPLAFIRSVLNPYVLLGVVR